ncbi:Drebrin-like protein, partial [Coniochaeta hoffmannii]
NITDCKLYYSEGELSELIEDFNEGRIQFAYVKVKDPNTGLPKNVLIAWCGGGVPERTRGYFTSHLSAVSKILHGYHVQITARSDADLEPEAIIQKVSDASGAKYTAGGSAPVTSAAPPTVAKKPVFTPTTSSTASSFNPIVAARNRRADHADDDGWGDAPQVTRTQLEKVESAYKPTRVNMAELSRGRDESTRFNGGTGQDDRPGVVKGAYQPVGKVDINAIRAAAQKKDDDRPAPVKGSYEPVGKVDIAAIRARAQKPSEPIPAADDGAEPPKSLAERTAAFTQPERLTELPKPKVAKKFGAAAAFTGTKAPTPVGFSAPAAPATPPVGAASRTFADQGGKTPAQIWAEKKAKERGLAPSPVASPPVTSPVTEQKSGSGWNSGYTGKSWGPVATTNFGRGGVETQRTGGTERSEPRSEPEAPASPAGGISAIRDRFKDAPPMGGATPAARQVSAHDDDETAPPPVPSTSRPSGPSGGFALPGLPSRPAPAEEPEEEEEEEQVPPVPSRDYEQEHEESPARIAIPVARKEDVEVEPVPQRELPPPLPRQAVEQEMPKPEEIPDEEETHDPRAAAAAVAEQSFGQEKVAEGQAGSGAKRALIQYDYEKAEDNEIDLVEGQYVTNIEMVDDDWWMGTNSKGESGLFPSNYVELVEDDAGSSAHAPAHAPAPVAEPEPEAQPSSGGATATALFDYEAAEDNELSFPEGAKITGLEFPDDDWWFGHYKGAQGLFPANYVELDA